MAKKRVSIDSVVRDANQEGIEIAYRGEIFETADAMPGLLMLKMAAATGDDASSGEQVGSMLDLLKYMIKDYDKFEEVALDPENPASQEEISEVIRVIVEEFSGRPTEASSSSADLGSPTTQNSTVGTLLSGVPTDS